MDTCIPTAMRATTRYRILTAAAAGAHLRRKFVEAMPAASSNPKGLLTPAQVGRDYCDQLFAAEKKLAELPAEERQKQRLAVEKPMLRAFWCWLEELEQQPLAGNLKKAAQYAPQTAALHGELPA